MCLPQPSGANRQNCQPASSSVAAFASTAFPALGSYPLPCTDSCQESLLGASLMMPEGSGELGSAAGAEELHIQWDDATPKAGTRGASAAAHALERSPDASAASHRSGASEGSVAALPQPQQLAAQPPLAPAPAHAGLTFIVTDEPVADRWARVRRRVLQGSPSYAALAPSPRPDAAAAAPAALAATCGPSMFEENAQMTPQAAPNALLAGGCGTPQRSARALVF